MINFKYQNRGFEQNLVLLPGWATDNRIFKYVNLPYNYVLPEKFDIYGFESGILSFLEKNNFEKISMLGYSLGGFVAAEFAGKYPEKINSLFLIGIRKQYDAAQIRVIKKYINKNKKLYLRNFYKSCFSNEKSFRKYDGLLFSDYCENLSKEELLIGLDYLAAARLNPEMLCDIPKIKIIHGALDKIAPIDETEQIVDDLLNAEFMKIPDCGHMVFLEKPSILCWKKQ